MPFGAVTLRPGVDVEKTFSLNEAGVSVSQIIRYRDGIIETMGGWQQYTGAAVGSTVRALHAWRDAAGGLHLGIGATHDLHVLTSGSNQDITPEIATTNFAPNFSVSSGSNVVTIIDSNSSGLPSVYNTIFFNTPIAVGNLLLNGAYDIATVTSSITFTILSSVAASTTIVSSGILPIFSISSGSGIVTVSLPNNNFVPQTGLFYSFYAPTQVGSTTDGLLIQGPYQVQSIIDSTNFTINSPTQSSTTATATMNSSRAQLVYYVTIGPQITGIGFGGLGFGLGGFGGVGGGLTGVSGTPIVTEDWSLDNWGQVLLACPKDGAIYTWSPDSGFANAQVISQAPQFNGGIFISMPQQILVAWRSCQSTGTQDNLRVRWCDAADYTNWEVSNQTTAGSFQLPTGSIIMGGLQAATQGIIWTDVDVWLMRYVGGDVIFNFSRVGSGCGLVGPHAAGTLAGTVYWMSQNNFYVMSDQGVQVLPCTVWDYVFQNLNETYIEKVRCAPNSAFSEITWFFPSDLSAGENDSYVKYDTVERVWDFGAMPRTAWTDVSVLGNPIGADPSSTLYQHEMGNVNSGVGAPSFQSGWWTITEGSDFAFVDYVILDFKWGTYSGAQTSQVTVTFYAADYPFDTPRSYGPYVVTSATEYITPRIRGRLMSVLVQGDGTSWWRLGKIRYRWAQAGRR